MKKEITVIVIMVLFTMVSACVSKKYSKKEITDIQTTDSIYNDFIQDRIIDNNEELNHHEK